MPQRRPHWESEGRTELGIEQRSQPEQDATGQTASGSEPCQPGTGGQVGTLERPGKRGQWEGSHRSDRKYRGQRESQRKSGSHHERGPYENGTCERKKECRGQE